MPYGENCTRNRCHREHGEMGGCKRSGKTGVLHPHLDGKDVNAIVCIHLQRLEVETICAVVLTCDGDVLDEERWGAGVVKQVSLAMKLEFPDADGFSMYYTQGGEENTMFFRIGSKKREFLPIMHRSVAIMSGDSADLWFITLDFILPFLAMPKPMQASFWSSGLTKTLFSCPQKVILKDV